jgi:hypothetical protein
MNFREYEDEDYDIIEGWWEGHGGQAPDPHLFSNCGRICDGLAASWLYISNSSIAFIGWPVTNPKAPKRTAMKAIRRILEDQRDLANASGASVVFVYTNSPALLKLLDRLGFQVGDRNVTNMISGV